MDNNKIKWSGNIKYDESYSSTIPTFGGVYLILRNDGKVGYLTNVYVGKAENLNSRYLDHLSANEGNSCIKNNLDNYECYFRYTILTREEDRQNLENRLLSVGKYQCNLQGQ